MTRNQFESFMKKKKCFLRYHLDRDKKMDYYYNYAIQLAWETVVEANRLVKEKRKNE